MKRACGRAAPRAYLTHGHMESPRRDEEPLRRPGIDTPEEPRVPPPQPEEPGRHGQPGREIPEVPGPGPEIPGTEVPGRTPGPEAPASPSTPAS